MRTSIPPPPNNNHHPDLRLPGGGLHILSVHRFSGFFLLDLIFPVYNGVLEQIVFVRLFSILNSGNNTESANLWERHFRLEREVKVESVLNQERGTRIFENVDLLNRCGGNDHGIRNQVT